MRTKIARISCFIIIIFLVSGCLKKSSSGIMPIIDIASNVKKMQKLEISQFSNSILYIPLEGRIENPLVWSTVMISDFSEKYIIDSDGRNCILYSNAGKFIRQIGKMGRGPGEYSNIVNVFLMDEKIYIQDYYNLLEYQIDGTFIKKYNNLFIINNEYPLQTTIMINDSIFLGIIDNITGEDKYKACILNKNGNIELFYNNHVFFNLDGISKTKSPIVSNHHWFKNKIYFNESLNDTLFLVDEKFKLSPIIEIKLGEYKEPTKERGKPWNLEALDSFIELYYIFQTEEKFFIVCDFNKYFPASRLNPEIIHLPGKDITQWYNSNFVLGIFDKRTKKLIFSEPTNTNNHLYTTGLYNNVDAGPRFLPVRQINDSVMVMKIKFEWLKEHVASDDFKNGIPKYPEKKKNLELLVDSLKMAEFDNPILMLVTFK